MSELLKSAEAGDAPAQYWYWSRQLEQVSEDSKRRHENTNYLAWNRKWAIDREREESKWREASDDDLEKAAQAGDFSARVVLDQRQVTEHFKRANEAVVWLQKSAELGYPRAEYEFALHCVGAAGLPEEVNQAKGLDFMGRAAAHGWVPAQTVLGAYYIAGEFVPADVSKGIEYLQMAADKGDPGAQYRLARLYATGDGDPPNTADAPLALLRKASRAGWGVALEALADCYRTGQGVPRDYVRASRYYQMARDADARGIGQGRSQAAAVFKLLNQDLEPYRAQVTERSPSPSSGGGFSIGSMPSPAAAGEFYNFAKVLGTYLRATEQTNASAMSQIGEWYSAGRFVPKDNVEAFRWFDRAAQAGAPEAAAARDRLKATLPQGTSTREENGDILKD